jgi:hypothetical protein
MIDFEDEFAFAIFSEERARRQHSLHPERHAVTKLLEFSRPMMCSAAGFHPDLAARFDTLTQSIDPFLAP